LQLSKGKLYTTPITKPKTGAEAVKDPFEADRAKYVDAGDYTVEISINGKTSTATWKLTN